MQRTQVLQVAYRSAKSALKLEIAKAKDSAWDELLHDLDRDPWGLPYRLVLKKLRRSQPSLTELLDSNVLQETISRLFPSDPECHLGSVVVDNTWNEEDSITVQEVHRIVRKRTAKNKAPGIDGLKASYIKRVPDKMIEKMAQIYNLYLMEGTFPELWKRAALILIPKGDINMLEPKVRPICLLSELGKVFERLIVDRINIWMEENPDLNLQ